MKDDPKQLQKQGARCPFRHGLYGVRLIASFKEWVGILRAPFVCQTSAPVYSALTLMRTRMVMVSSPEKSWRTDNTWDQMKKLEFSLIANGTTGSAVRRGHTHKMVGLEVADKQSVRSACRNTWERGLAFDCKPPFQAAYV